MRCLGSLAVSTALIVGTTVSANETVQKPPSQPAAEHEQPPLRVMQTQDGTHFGVFVHLEERLAGKAVLLSIGNDDHRVSTQDCVAFAQTLVAATRRLRPALPVIPVELMVGPTSGHQAVDDAYLLEARFLRKWLR
jgi:hypothetical protein